MVDKLAGPNQANGTAVMPEDPYKRLGIEGIPFRSRLSFRLLIEFLEKHRKDGFAESMLAREVLARLEKAPELRKPVEDPEVLERHQDLVDLLLSSVLPPVMRDTQLAKVCAPFHFHPFYITPALREVFNNHRVRYTIGGPKDIVYSATVVGACGLILNKFYGQQIQVAPSVSMSLETEDSPLQRHFKTNLDFRFVDIKKLKPLRPLSQEQIHRLLSNIYDLDLWLEYIPAENFEFNGFVIGHLIDITEEEALSQLKYRLLRKDAIVDSDNVRELERLVRTYFNLPDLRLGVTAIDYPMDIDSSHRYRIRFDFLAEKHASLLSQKNRNSIYEKACKYKEVLLIEDLESLPHKTPIERDLVAEGIRSIIVAPLFNKKEEVIGLLELGSPRPYELHSFVELKFKEIIGLFSLAVERSREEIDNQIEAIIREQFTAVHPSVEWRFIEASYNLLSKRDQGAGESAIEPIVFHNVYPLYGQADIVNSSEIRNSAIQADLSENLRRAEQLIERCLEQIRFPLLNQILLKVRRALSSLQEEFNSNDESRIVEMLQQEVHPVLDYLRKNNPDLAGLISGYFNYLDRELQIVYRKRKAYEESVAMVNSTISNYLEHQEKETQKVIPHYFEKYKTDGVEYDIYVGQALLKQGEFSEMHLRNLRLWQLLQMCEITCRVKDLQEYLSVPLDTAQLVFAYSNALSIRFRMDEKQFDVDGAYNVRYEILKKRIDKATIQGNRSAQMMFKTALRNHLDLSTLADNKANIMLSVNALILTIAGPLALSYVSNAPLLIIPLVMLLVTCLASMIFATLATRPIKMTGYTPEEQIIQGRANLFFFGNFYEMTFDEYSQGMQMTIDEEDRLENSIRRDLYFLGKSLGKKYRQLRICYNIFMAGMIVTIVTMIVAYSFTIAQQ